MKTIKDSGMVIEVDGPVTMNDGIQIRYAVYRPDHDGHYRLRPIKQSQ